MYDLILELLSFSFVTRALLVGVLISLCASLLGVSLVLKRYSMIGDGLSHVGFGALAIATALNKSPLFISIVVVIFAAFILLRLSSDGIIKGDSAIALLSSSSLAVGVVILSLSRGSNIDVYNYMFGSILAMSETDVKISIILSVVVVFLFVFLYNKIFAITFDETFLKASGVKIDFYNMLIAFLTAITIVLGMRMMGALLISALLIFPALTSMRVCKTFKSVIVLSAFVSVISFIIGIVASYVFETPTGASVVIVNSVFFILFSLVSGILKLIKR